MNMIRAIAFNVRGLNLETDAYRRPRTARLSMRKTEVLGFFDQRLSMA
jgi:hypothetical protein